MTSILRWRCGMQPQAFFENRLLSNWLVYNLMLSIQIATTWWLSPLSSVAKPAIIVHTLVVSCCISWVLIIDLPLRTKSYPNTIPFRAKKIKLFPHQKGSSDGSVISCYFPIFHGLTPLKIHRTSDLKFIHIPSIQSLPFFPKRRCGQVDI